MDEETTSEAAGLLLEGEVLSINSEELITKRHVMSVEKHDTLLENVGTGTVRHLLPQLIW